MALGCGELTSLLNPARHVAQRRAEILALHSGDLQAHELAVELWQGGVCKLLGGDDACVEQQPAILAADCGDAGQVRQCRPLVDVLGVELEMGCEVVALSGRLGVLPEVERGLDACAVEQFQIFGAEAGELGDRPIAGTNGLGQDLARLGRHFARFRRHFDLCGANAVPDDGSVGAGEEQPKGGNTTLRDAPDPSWHEQLGEPVRRAALL